MVGRICPPFLRNAMATQFAVDTKRPDERPGLFDERANGVRAMTIKPSKLPLMFNVSTTNAASADEPHSTLAADPLSLVSLFGAFQGLHDLRLESAQLGPVMDSMHAAVSLGLHGLLQLTSLCLRHNKLKLEHLRQLGVTSLDKLKYLDLGVNLLGCSDSSVRLPFAGFTHLQELDLEFNQLKATDLLYLNIAQLKNIYKLNVRGNQVGGAVLCPNVYLPPSLRILDASANIWMPGALHRLSFHKLVNLRELYLGYSNLLVESDVAAVTKDMLDLRVLHMHRVKWSLSSDCNSFSLSCFKRLKTFTWTDNKNDESACCQILEAIAPTIEYLHFDSIRLSYAAAKLLLKSKFPHLKEIEIRGNFMGKPLADDGILKQAPNLQRYSIGTATYSSRKDMPRMYVGRKWAAKFPDSQISGDCEFISA